jgi:hypothetical protein
MDPVEYQWEETLEKENKGWPKKKMFPKSQMEHSSGTQESCNGFWPLSPTSFTK